MSARTILIVFLALAAGASVAVGVTRIRNQDSSRDTVSIVVADRAISRGAQVSADSIKMRDYPRDLVPAGAITRREDAVERFVFTAMAKDDPVVETKLAAKGAGRGLAPLIPKGMRAFTIHTPNLESGVAGFVLPGNRVDVLLTISDIGPNDHTGGGSTTTLLQNLEILAVDQRVEAPAENKVDPKDLRSVTLLVTPDQAAKLDLGQNKGTLHLSLRHPDDKDPADTRPATLAGIRFQQEKPWDERAKGVLAALVEATARRQQKDVQAVPTPPPTARVRLIRGVYERVVNVETSEVRSP